MLGTWKTGFVSQGPCQLEYKYQNHPGKPWVVFLHGFGQDFHAFDPVYAVLEGQNSFLALQIFFHGESSMEGEAPLKPSDWMLVINQLFKKLEIENAHWMAYSMGSKFTLLTYQLQPDLFNGLTLLAPDGLVMNPWYKFATRTFFGRIILKTSLRFYFIFRYLVRFLGFIGLVKPGVIRFAQSQLSDKQGRELVQSVWLRFRLIWPESEIWSLHLENRPIPFLVCLGKFDRIIPARKFQSKRNLWKGVQWLNFDAGHASLISKFAESINKQDPGLP